MQINIYILLTCYTNKDRVNWEEKGKREERVSERKRECLTSGRWRWREVWVWSEGERRLREKKVFGSMYGILWG